MYIKNKEIYIYIFAYIYIYLFFQETPVDLQHHTYKHTNESNASLLDWMAVIFLRTPLGSPSSVAEADL